MKKLLSILGSLVISGTSTSLLVNCTQEKCENKIFGNWKQVCKKDKPFKYQEPDFKYYLIIYITNVDKKWNITMIHWDGINSRPDLIGWSSNWKEVYIWTKNTIPTDNDIPKIDNKGNIII